MMNNENIKYAIVETIEEGNSYCSAVPETWINDGVLRWPLRGADVMKGRKLGITPKENWRFVPCRIISKGIDNFKTALELEAKAEIMTSSSDEMCSTKKTHSIPLDFNDIMDEINEYESPTEQIQIEPIIVPSEIVETTNLLYTTEPMQNAQFIETLNTGCYVNCTNCSKIDERFDAMEQSITEKMDVGFKAMERSIAEIKITMDVILEKITSSRLAATETIDESEWDKFPLQTVDEIENLEKRLRSDKHYKINLKSKLSVFGGADELGSAKILCKWLFKDSLLQNFSWAGTSEKHAFNSLKEILEIIIQSVRISHPAYTAHSNANFLKNYLKHAKFRILSKNKPKNTEDRTEPIIDSTEVTPSQPA